MADFFTRFREQVNAGITTLTTKSRVVVETTRLRSQIRKLAKEKTDALTQLGTQVYQEICQRGHLEQEGRQEAIKPIQELDRALEHLRQEITRLAELDMATP